jgi:Rab11 family-interacting protein 1/2/5
MSRNFLFYEAISILCCDCRQIPKQGNVAEIVLTVLHRNFIGVDEFLGVISIPLADFDVYERPRNR